VKQLSSPSRNILIDVEMFVGSKHVKKIQEEKGKQQCLKTNFFASFLLLFFYFYSSFSFFLFFIVYFVVSL
jgi:hypothetical protein